MDACEGLLGIGGSPEAPRSGDNRTLARIVHATARTLGARELTLVGHDLGGMIAYAYLRMYPRELRQDAEDNQRDLGSPLPLPVLYLRGGAEKGLELDNYVAGLRASGLSAVEGRTIAGSGHFAPDEQPDGVAEALRQFVHRAA